MPLIPLIFLFNAIVCLLLIGPVKGSMAEAGVVFMMVLNGGMAVYSYLTL